MNAYNQRFNKKEFEMLFPGEEEAIKYVIEMGKKYGYGNMIAHLKREWAEHLIEYGLTETAALSAANSSSYSLRKVEKAIKRVKLLEKAICIYSRENMEKEISVEDMQKIVDANEKLVKELEDVKRILKKR
jgi:hypothetical protein